MAHTRDTGHERSAAELLTPVLRRQVDDLRRWEVRVREQEPEAVHQFRVSARRLRSGLSGFEPLLGGHANRALGKDLRRAAGAIGGGRDVQAVRTRLHALWGEEEDPASSRLHLRLSEGLDHLEGASWHDSIAHLDHVAYDDFTRRLEHFADLPPWLPTADLPAAEALRPILRSEWGRFRLSIREALDPSTSSEDERLHETRKASKRARYVAESLVVLFGRKAERVARAAQRVQVVLGKHQDLRLVLEFLDDARDLFDVDGGDARILSRAKEGVAAQVAALRPEIEGCLQGAEDTSLPKWMR